MKHERRDDWRIGRVRIVALEVAKTTVLFSATFLRLLASIIAFIDAILAARILRNPVIKATKGKRFRSVNATYGYPRLVVAGSRITCT